MENIGSILRDFLKQNELEDKIGQYKIFNEWKNLVGEKVFENAKPEKIINDVLYIKVENPSWKTELNFMKKELLININNRSTSKFKNIKII